MKASIFIFCLFSSVQCFAKKTPAKYFILNNDTRQNFTKYDHIAGDTVFFIINSSQQFILIDSIKAIHVLTRSHAIGGGIAGFFTGIIFGTGIGIALAKNGGEFSGLSNAVVGAGIGIPVGTALGIMAGSDGVKLDIDLIKYSKEERLKLLPVLLKDV